MKSKNSPNRFLLLSCLSHSLLVFCECVSDRAGTMGAHGSREHSIPDPPRGALKVMADMRGKDVLDEVKLWHREAGFHLTGTLSVRMLDEVRERLTRV